jgi:hypothetical protein
LLTNQKRTELEKIVRDLLVQHLITNPWPWRIVGDWTDEVTASNGAIVAKCQNRSDAERILRTAEEIRIEMEQPVDLWGV